MLALFKHTVYLHDKSNTAETFMVFFINEMTDPIMYPQSYCYLIFFARLQLPYLTSLNTSIKQRSDALRTHQTQHLNAILAVTLLMEEVSNLTSFFPPEPLISHLLRMSVTFLRLFQSI